MGNDEQTCSCGIGGKAGSLRQCSYPEIDERRTICVSFFMFLCRRNRCNCRPGGRKKNEDWQDNVLCHLFLSQFFPWRPEEAKLKWEVADLEFGGGKYAFLRVQVASAKTR